MKVSCGGVCVMGRSVIWSSPQDAAAAQSRRAADRRNGARERLAESAEVPNGVRRRTLLRRPAAAVQRHGAG